eukprot:Nitzschia sp. Nitz4//scaffold150_size53981//33462//34724//NITZ4_006680-RA/size53981-processed-gene-0.85-mRNA-1//-1//CDS//3329537080//6294//frame0
MNPLPSITPTRTLVTSFNPKTTAASQMQASQTGDDSYFEEGDWVLCVTGSSPGGSNWLGCALSNGEVQVYDQTKLLPLQTYHHKGFVTDLVRDTSNPNALIASSADGTVAIYDVRQSCRPAIQVSVPLSEEALSVSVGFDGNIAAVGTHKAKIHFFDVRGGRSIVGTYNQAHTNEITRVRFQTMSGAFGASSATTPLLVSAAEDGLACVYDTSQATEEAAIQNVLSVQAPIREIGFFGPQSEAIYCLTGSESLLLYHKDDAVCRKDFGVNTRHELNHLLNSTGTNAVAPMEYLVDCRWDSTLQELQLLAGSVQGDAAMYSVGERGLSFKHRLEGGHRGVIRAWDSLSTNTFVTVGEDARLCEWNRISTGSSLGGSSQRKTPEIVVPPTAMNKPRSGGVSLNRPGGGKVRRPRSRLSAAPY